VAIRRFLMLAASGFDIPDRYKKTCEALMLSCPSRDLRRIQGQVQSWADMLGAPQPDHFEQLGVPVDKFEHLHAISRRLAL
jgi:hypothetical protein